MKRYICLISFVLVASMAVLSAMAASWELVYTADVVPHDESLKDEKWNPWDPTGPQGEKEFAKIEPKGELHINDNVVGKLLWYHRVIKDGTCVTMEARVKALKNTSTWNVFMGIESKADAIWVLMFPDQIKVGDQSHKVDMTKYHIVRLVKDDKKATMYLDGQEVMKGNTEAKKKRSIIAFGSGTGGGEGESYWDYIAYTTSGAFSPQELSGPFAAVRSEGKLATSWAAIKIRH